MILDFLKSGQPETALPAGVARVTLAAETAIELQLEAIAKQYGAIGISLYLQSPNQKEAAAQLKQVFFLAKHLKHSLTEAAQTGRSCFLTVAHLDGALGLSGQQDFNPIAGGLLGLTKALRWEWSEVFCRAIDLSPDLAPDLAAQYIMAELHDPNRLIAEVAYGTKGRTTLVGV